MFGSSGHAYVYGVYGTVCCLNVVTGPPGEASAVLVRAVVPLSGTEAMRAARVRHAVATRRADRLDPSAAASRLARVPDVHLTLGPGNLAAAFDVERADDGADLLDPAGSLRLVTRPESAERFAIVSTPRIGVAYAGPEWGSRPWRFVVSRD
jgi:DNA-3-methyladenine glycosylase